MKTKITLLSIFLLSSMTMAARINDPKVVDRNGDTKNVQVQTAKDQHGNPQVNHKNHKDWQKNFEERDKIIKAKVFDEKQAKAYLESIRVPDTERELQRLRDENAFYNSLSSEQKNQWEKLRHNRPHFNDKNKQDRPNKQPRIPEPNKIYVKPIK